MTTRGRVRGPQYKERTIIARRGTSEEEWEEEDSNIGFAGEGEITIREEETEGGSQLTERTDQPERALRSKGAAPAIQLGTREATVEVTATAWISKDEGTRGTILRGETEGPEHRRQEDELDVQLGDGSLKTLTVGQEDDQSTPIPQREVERNQREPADLTGISGAASDEDPQEVYQEQQITNPCPVGCSSTSLGREIRKRTNYQVVEQTETPSRGPRSLVSEDTPVARQLQFNFTTGEGTSINKRKREYGKRKRGSEETIDYEVESVVITDRSTINIERNQDDEGISELKRSEETVLAEVGEEVQEEDEEGAQAWSAQITEEQTKLITEKDEQTVTTPIREVSSSELNTSENETDPSGVEKTVVESETTTRADSETVAETPETNQLYETTVLKKRSNDEETVELNQERQQPEALEEELLEETRRAINNEDTPESLAELEGEETGASVTNTTYPEGNEYEGTVAGNEKEEEHISVVDKATKKTFTPPLVTIGEHVKETDFENTAPEIEEDKKEVNAASGVSVEEFPKLQKGEAIDSTRKGKQKKKLEYTFEKQESIGELYQKVLDAVASYQQEKAADAQYQAYKARMAVVVGEAEGTEYQSPSHTQEADEELDELINRAEKTAKERARILKRIRVDARDIYENLEEVRWNFSEFSRGNINIHEASQAQSKVIKADQSRSRAKSRGSYQEKEHPEAGRENTESGKEKEEEYQETALRRYSKKQESGSEKTIGKPVLKVNEQSNENPLENPNKLTRGVEFDQERYKRGRPIHSGTADSLKQSKGKAIEEASENQLRHEVGGVSHQKEGFETLEGYKRVAEVATKGESQ